MFDTTKEDLKDLLGDAHEGRLQLPDFQREYVWGDEDVRSLIASVAKGFPVGALLTLRAGGDVRFKPRLLAGVPAQDVQPDELLLDGQQRITSLYQSTYADQPVRTRTHPRNRSGSLSTTLTFGRPWTPGRTSRTPSSECRRIGQYERISGGTLSSTCPRTIRNSRSTCSR